MPVKKFIASLFASRDFAHKNHLATTSFAKHSALGSFYEDIVGEADAFAEMWQGRNSKRIGPIPTFESKTGGNPATVLRGHLDEIEPMKEKVCGDCSALQNKFDEIVGVYLSTLYKLEFLE